MKGSEPIFQGSELLLQEPGLLLGSELVPVYSQIRHSRFGGDRGRFGWCFFTRRSGDRLRIRTRLSWRGGNRFLQMQIVLVHIHWKSDEDTSKSNVLFSDGIPGELQPRTDPIEK